MKIKLHQFDSSGLIHSIIQHDKHCLKLKNNITREYLKNVINAYKDAIIANSG